LTWGENNAIKLAYHGIRNTLIRSLSHERLTENNKARSGFGLCFNRCNNIVLPVE